MTRFRLLIVLAALLMVLGCTQKTVVVDPMADQGPQTMGLDYRDFDKAANTAINDLLLSGALNKPGGGRYVMAISRVINDTMQRIDTDQLTKKIRVALLQSGKVVTTTAVGAGGPEDAMSMQVRELRQSEEFNQSTVAATGQMIAPELSLSGKILQRNNTIDGGSQQIDYYFMMSMTDVTTGLALWETEIPIIKRGDSSTVSW